MKRFLLLLILAPFLINAQAWNWSEIDTEQMSFPAGFLWGSAISEYQNSGAYHCPASNWAAWEQTKTFLGYPHIALGQQSGSACDHWNLYKNDVQLLKELNLNTFRLSVEWSRIEPVEGMYDESALDHYSDEIDALLAAGIEPMVSLHHFTDPLWFSLKGGFEKEENVHYFVEFCQKVFARLSDRECLWITINEPTIYMFQGYLRGVFPPGKCNPLLAVRVLRNLLQAHTETYQALKAMDHGTTAQIGVVHQYLMFLPYGNWNPLERIPGLMFNYILNTAVLNFFKTGTFQISIPVLFDSSYQAPEGPLMDFIGLNYYSRVLAKAQLSLFDPIVPTCYPGEIMTDFPYAMYPQGLYEAIAKMAELNVPIYVTENGIPDEKDDRRGLFFEQYLYALSCALADGYDVRGYYYWSLMDNFEWDEGFTKKFGLCHVDFTTKKRTIRTSAWRYRDIIMKKTV